MISPRQAALPILAPEAARVCRYDLVQFRGFVARRPHVVPHLPYRLAASVLKRSVGEQLPQLTPDHGLLPLRAYMTDFFP